MEGHRVAPEIIDYYSSAFDESARLSSSGQGELEFLRTQELLRRHLPAPPASVLDVGGGPGIHARWLVADGFEVHLVDPVERHVRQARAVCDCTTELGDARTLRAEDGSYDAVLLLGPLYHLLKRADRVQALREARRVLRPGALMAAAAISRHAELIDLAATARLTPAATAITQEVLASGCHTSEFGFTTAYFHTAAELQAEATDAGFTDVRLFGVEGPTWAVLKGIATHTGGSLTGSPLVASAVTAARIAESDPALIPCSSHLITFGRAPDR
ncbi:class I SAM-dependent methyltransferase [Actinoallomurus purpureus]|uniref:class I SAM-dependent methyltransferase n=1 Tax=Actinoallomurus purpureus TaxID=478114 RepID=UPI0020935CB4|nr:class I SAM-dependent methyltransferase [Actinoallomurus purpureus]MCO6009473.1 class I SAM-dependent methyltransferase [Actinoallomurus purpureus]